MRQQWVMRQGYYIIVTDDGAGDASLPPVGPRDGLIDDRVGAA